MISNHSISRDAVIISPLLGHEKEPVARPVAIQNLSGGIGAGFIRSTLQDQG